MSGMPQDPTPGSPEVGADSLPDDYDPSLWYFKERDGSVRCNRCRGKVDERPLHGCRQAEHWERHGLVPPVVRSPPPVIVSPSPPSAPQTPPVPPAPSPGVPRPEGQGDLLVSRDVFVKLLDLVPRLKVRSVDAVVEWLLADDVLRSLLVDLLPPFLVDKNAKLPDVPVRLPDRIPISLSPSSISTYRDASNVVHLPQGEDRLNLLLVEMLARLPAGMKPEDAAVPKVNLRVSHSTNLSVEYGLLLEWARKEFAKIYLDPSCISPDLGAHDDPCHYFYVDGIPYLGICSNDFLVFEKAFDAFHAEHEGFPFSAMMSMAASSTPYMHSTRRQMNVNGRIEMVNGLTVKDIYPNGFLSASWDPGDRLVAMIRMKDPARDGEWSNRLVVFVSASTGGDVERRKELLDMLHPPPQEGASAQPVAPPPEPPSPPSPVSGADSSGTSSLLAVGTLPFDGNGNLVKPSPSTSAAPAGGKVPDGNGDEENRHYWFSKMAESLGDEKILTEGDVQGMVHPDDRMDAVCDAAMFLGLLSLDEMPGMHSYLQDHSFLLLSMDELLTAARRWTKGNREWYMKKMNSYLDRRVKDGTILDPSTYGNVGDRVRETVHGLGKDFRIVDARKVKRIGFEGLLVSDTVLNASLSLFFPYRGVDDLLKSAAPAPPPAPSDGDGTQTVYLQVGKGASLSPEDVKWASSVASTYLKHEDVTREMAEKFVSLFVLKTRPAAPERKGW